MFYNYLIRAFLSDQSLFSDVKAIVDCPLKCDPADVIKACRELDPREILKFLEAPGADLETPELKLTEDNIWGRNQFLKLFRIELGDLNTRRHIQRRNTISVEWNPKLPPPLRSTERRRSGFVQSVDMAKYLQMDILTATELELEGAKQVGELARYKKSSDSGEADSFTRSLLLQHYYTRLQRLGLSIIRLWAHFYRKVSTSYGGDRKSLVQLPKPFIVPGGRFIEIYYWDSYWIIRGLLSSSLYSVARDTLENFLYMVERFGFIPNGSRKYYQDRSQPPFLTTMMHAYWNATGDTDFVAHSYSIMEKEYAFWMNERLGHAIRLEIDDNGRTTSCILNRYYSLEVTPRPESYRIDETMGELYKTHKGTAETLPEFYRAIRAGAESGWDFSSRWLRPAVEGLGEAGIRADHKIDTVLHKLCLIDIDTCNIIPCDLNGIMYGVEQDLSFFAELLGYTTQVQLYKAAALKRQKAMLRYNWDAENERWMDYDMRNGKLSKVISAASFVPLWAGVNDEVMNEERRVYLASKLAAVVRPYGIVCTNIKAGLQWDSPNVWACSHHMAVDFLCGGRFWEAERCVDDKLGPAFELAIDWASRFVNTVLNRFEFKGVFSEKYHCYQSGKSGSDGEYVTQEGFGWTNGTVLDFLEKFGARLTPQGLYLPK